MNRTGLFIAMAMAVVIGLVFGLYPELDLKLAALFYDRKAATFPLQHNFGAILARDGAMWIAWALVLPALVSVIAKLMRPSRRLWISPRTAVFLLTTMIATGVVLTNLTFKAFWGRPRPVAVTEFAGQHHFVAWWDPRGDCSHNCSFISGEGATAFWTLAPAALLPPPYRAFAYGAAIVFGVATSLLRMAFGGHFFTDVAFAGLTSFIVIWFAHGLIYRWRRTRWSDAAVDGWLTRLGQRLQIKRNKAAATPDRERAS